jgi:cation diffusion facilitator family transporter
MEDRAKLTRFAWLSVITALITIALKVSAYLLTDSVGLLSDALESGVNLVAAIVALVALIVAARPPDDEHAYGHTKAEYFSGGIEGTMILIAALLIIGTAVERLLNPQPLQQLNLGLIVSLVAAGLNLVVALVLQRAAHEYESTALEADARHLLTDVWTSAGVLLGIGAVSITGWQPLDSIIGLLVAVHILRAGFQLVDTAVHGLMDTALPEEEQALIVSILESYSGDGVQYHALRTRQSGAQRFVSVHIQVPGNWSVQRGHSLLEQIEREMRQALPRVSILTHLEPVEDPVSWHDIPLNRRTSEEEAANGR